MHSYAAAEDAANPSHRPAAQALAQLLRHTGTDDPARRRLLDSVSTAAASRAGWIDGGGESKSGPNTQRMTCGHCPNPDPNPNPTPSGSCKSGPNTQRMTCGHCRDHHADDPCGELTVASCPKPCRHECMQTTEAPRASSASGHCGHCRDHHGDDPCGAKSVRRCTKPCKEKCMEKTLKRSHHKATTP